MEGNLKRGSLTSAPSLRLPFRRQGDHYQPKCHMDNKACLDLEKACRIRKAEDQRWESSFSSPEFCRILGHRFVNAHKRNAAFLRSNEGTGISILGDLSPPIYLAGRFQTQTRGFPSSLSLEVKLDYIISYATLSQNVTGKAL